MILYPNAKINLGLNIISRRKDGYHNIETIMYPINWCDILEIVPAKGSEATLTVTGRVVNCPPEKNLVMKAFRLFQEQTGINNVDIYLHKIIPDGAGLGGGSSDAAFTLLGLNKIFDCGLSNDQLATMAAKIGADCPFFIYNKPKLATGIGTEFTVANIDLRDYIIAVVKPQASVPTAQAYAGVRPQIPNSDLLQDAQRPINQWTGVIKNDFEKSVFPTYPEIALIKKQLADMGAIYTAMSGSGSAVFGIFGNYDNLAETLKSRFTDCDTFASKL